MKIQPFYSIQILFGIILVSTFILDGVGDILTGIVFGIFTLGNLIIECYNMEDKEKKE